MNGEQVTTDETFLVVEGVLRINFRDGHVLFGPGQMYVMPKGVEHKTSAVTAVKMMIIGPCGTLNAGHEGGDRTAENDVWI
ncbi:cupin domain-containing protein [Cronobacter turicensis]|nr:cupin domain-containing protein [Cronobacter turicensis]